MSDVDVLLSFPPPFHLPCSCLRCAGEVELVNATSSDSGTLSVAILACEPCRLQFEVTARMNVHRVPKQERAADRKQRQREREKVTA